MTIMWKGYLITGVCLASLCMGCSVPDPDEEASPGNPVLFSISPSEMEDGAPGDAFHRYPILGKVTVEGDDRGALLEAWAKAQADAPGLPALCFDPRHGLRLMEEDASVEYVICFECYSIHTYRDGELSAKGTIAASARGVFNRILSAAEIPLAE